jgi:O-antigen/teichoic acid export membrane protein
MTPLYLHLMPPQEYGIFGVLSGFMNMSSILLSLGLRQLLAMQFFHTTGTQRREFINELVITYLCIATPTVLIGIYYRTTLTSLLFTTPVSSSLMIICLLTIYQWFFTDLAYQLLQYTQRPIPLAILQTCIALINATLSVLFVVVYKWGAQGILLAQLIGLTIATVSSAMGYFIKKFHHSFKVPGIHVLRTHLRHSIPLMPSLLFTWLLTYGDRIMLVRMSSLHSVGLYSVADAFGLLFYLLITYPWLGAYQPQLLQRFAHSYQDPHKMIVIEKQNQRLMWLCMGILLCLVLIGYTVVMPLIMLVIPPTYHQAIPFIFAIITTQIILLGTNFVLCLIQFLQHTSFLALSWCIPAVLKICLNLLLIPRYDLAGCTTATIMAYGTYFCIVLSYNRLILITMAKEKQQSFNTMLSQLK